ADRFAAAGLTDASTIAGSFFDPLPAGSDAYVLSDILHDWNDERARAILAACGRAARPDGVVLVIEPIRGSGVGTAMDLFMLMCFEGHERTVAELTELASDCDLEFQAATPVSDGRTVVEFRPRAAPGPRRQG
ncbi:methyltransferase, partial [Nocardia gipuzkoensis]